MNKKNLTALSICVLLAACVHSPPAAKGECDTINVPVECTGSKSNPVLSITLVRDGIRMGPRNVCAQPNTKIEVSIHPTQTEKGSVETIPKNPLHTWLKASNSTDPNSFTIDVPADVVTNANYDYTIVRSNSVCLDPRIRVEPGG